MGIGRKLGVLMVGVAWLALFSPAAAQEVNRVVAVVGDEVITSQEQARMAAIMESALGPAANQEEARDRAERINKIALDRLIEDKVFTQEVERLGIRVSDAEIDAYLKRLKADNKLDEKGFLARLSRQGMTPEEYRAQVKTELLKQKLIRDQVRESVVISDEQVAAYYKEHKAEFAKVDSVRLRALFLKLPQGASEAEKAKLRREIEKLRQEAVAKKNLAELARQYSQGPGAAQGGELGPLPFADLLPEMRGPLAKLKTGETSPVLEMPGSLFFMELIQRTGSGERPLEEVRDEILRTLEKKALDQKFAEWLKDLRDQVYVKIIQ